MTRGCGLATKGAVRFMERIEATPQSMSFGCHCERSAAIHTGMKSWIATAFGLAMTGWMRPRDDEGVRPRDEGGMTGGG